MGTTTGTAAAECSTAIEAVHRNWFIGMLVAKANASPKRSSQVSRQLDNFVTSRFHLRTNITYVQLLSRQTAGFLERARGYPYFHLLK